MTNIMERFVKPEVLKNIESFKIDLESTNNLLTTNSIDIGYTTRDALRHTKNISQLKILQFKNTCRTCLKIFICKILNRSPLNYKLVKAISCVDPSIAANEGIAKARLNTTHIADICGK
ncbi:PREDICTED: uncharacterized protein LOC108779229 [Cyphomyrmex costatus]|uniref:uncharacterized protein LOC108779229 n=1 Tax=Cyphomyrmex costatus TaxID=456900 RepID=UPI0008523232|nr:PREDICTED: uncharacterized protein LOC108779229 [Cyphomyrmex costatus]